MPQTPKAIGMLQKAPAANALNNEFSILKQYAAKQVASAEKKATIPRPANRCQRGGVKEVFMAAVVGALPASKSKAECISLTAAVILTRGMRKHDEREYANSDAVPELYAGPVRSPSAGIRCCETTSNLRSA
jgi:hypothetical protein